MRGRAVEPEAGLEDGAGAEDGAGLADGAGAGAAALGPGLDVAGSDTGGVGVNRDAASATPADASRARQARRITVGRRRAIGGAEL